MVEIEKEEEEQHSMLGRVEEEEKERGGRMRTQGNFNTKCTF